MSDGMDYQLHTSPYTNGYFDKIEPKLAKAAKLYWHHTRKRGNLSYEIRKSK